MLLEDSYSLKTFSHQFIHSQNFQPLNFPGGEGGGAILVEPQGRKETLKNLQNSSVLQIIFF